jgi:glycosyltransferase involved in cell wall biosynthesis
MRERHNDNALLTAIEYFKPDVIMFWGMWMLSRHLPSIAEDSEVPVAYMIEDYWPIDEDVHTWYWNSQANRHLARPLKGLANRLALARLRREGYPPELAFDHVACGSRFLKEEISAVIPAFRQAEVVMCGIDLAPFYENQSDGKLDTSRGLRIAYVGGLNAEKGVKTAISAVAQIMKMNRTVVPILTVVGGGHADYEASLYDLVKKCGVEDQVTFLGRVPKESVPKILSKNDVLVVPSIWPEPFGRVVVEGMAARLLVIGTATGGSGEILEDGVNGLVFEPGNATALAQCLGRVSCDSDLYARIVDEAVRTSTRFSVERMADGLERFLVSIANASGHN